jgi:phosphoribosylformylglycinamidine synthase subunit PurQ / glutaminase
MIRTCIITGYGINADAELAEAFERAGSKAERVHINDITESPQVLDSYQILGFPGGFSFGDHIGSGKVFGNLFKKRLKDRLDSFVEKGKLVIGICNGFQVLVKMGFLPNLEGDWTQDVSLIHNDSGKFEDRWVTCRIDRESDCVWTAGIERLEMPVRHGEGKFVIGSKEAENAILKKKLAVIFYDTRNLEEPERVRAGKKSRDGARVDYPDNPNGSVHNIAGITDRTGRVFGLMPHPEAFIFPQQHPRWKREPIESGSGLLLFKNAVEYFK